MGVKTLLDLSTRVALVTGGSRGLGLQIAEALGIPTETAASRYRYALAKLHEEFAEEPIL